MKRAIIYSRVSSDEQADNYSLPSQEAASRRYAEQQGLTVVAAVSDVMSGAILERPSLTKVRDLIRAKAVDAVIVYSSDRLTRSVAHAMLLRDEVKTAGVELHTVARGITQDSPEGGLMETIEAAFAEYERLKIRERTQRGMRRRLESDLGHGNKLPFGYRYTDDQRVHIEIDEEEAAIIRMIYGWYLEGYGTLQIVGRLSELRIPTPADRRFYIKKVKMRERGEWSGNTVGAMLHNPAYKGDLLCRHGKDSFIFSIPPIIDPLEWEAVAHIREERYARIKVGRKMNSKFYLLTGHVKCGMCGAACAGSQGGRGIHHYYRCHRIKTTHTTYPPKCNLPQFPCEALDDIIWTWIDAEVLSEDRIRAAVEGLDDKAESERDRILGERNIIARQLEILDAQASKLIELYTAGVFNLEEIAAQKQHLDQARESCRSAIETMEQRLTGMATAQDRADELCELVRAIRDNLAQLTPEKKRRFIDLLGVEITLTHEGEAGRGKRPARFADVICHLTLDAIRLKIAGVSMDTTTPFSP
ncbi:recombinase family protein [Oscillochloris sp. ZM17-4]|uniref:recombinase family protein n=1 Tax=Oscillochloris sp. ZM17-4 TaxID=2866714 RepID=UPI001C72C9F7|nr:recombinase family protein [Oscillochloris sp. ZM17-4]MBX0329782.1 recombinase family protein [Oscillochloris sp. ZM17-4]